jgi:hypothetical protein
MTLDWSIAIYIIGLVLYSDRHNVPAERLQVTSETQPRSLVSPLQQGYYALSAVLIDSLRGVLGRPIN